ncbi:MAG: ABC transporter permease subunit [Velocimicrobium sp.]
MKKIYKYILFALLFITFFVIYEVSSDRIKIANAKVGSQKLATVDDIKDKRIGLLLGSVHDTYVAEHYPDATVVQFKNLPDLIVALKAKKLDVAIYTYETLEEILKTDESMDFLGDSLFGVSIGTGFNKENTELRDEFNCFLETIKSNGVYDDMADRWMKGGSHMMPDIENKENNGTMVVGIVSDKGLPFAIIENGELVGYDVELTERFAAELGKKCVFSDMDFSSLIPAVTTNKIDMITSTLMITEEREKQINFSNPYYELGAGVVALKENLTKYQGQNADGSQIFTSAEDVKDKCIGVLLGSVHDDYAAKNYPDATVIQYKTSADVLVALKSKKIDAAIYNREAMAEILKTDKSMDFLEKNLYENPIGMGFNKENTKLLNEFNDFLEKIKGNGVYDEMLKRWMVDGIQTMPELVNKENNGTLVVGVVSDKGLPFTILKDGNYIGFDVEMAERFAAEYDRRLVIKDMEFGSLIAAVSTNKIDMITSTLMITPERKKKINFSNPYYQVGAGLVVLKEKLVTDVQGNGSAETKSSFIKSITDSFYNNIIFERRYKLILGGLKVTMIIAVFAGIFGTILGMLICFIRMSGNPILSNLAQIYIAILRGTPVLVFLMIIYYVVFASVNINPMLVAVIAFGMNFASYASEMFRTAIISIDRGQNEAGIAGGFTKTQTFLYIILPQAIKQVLPVYKGEVISLVKSTSIVGYIAVQDLTKASDIIRSRTFDAFFPLIMVAVLYFIISGLFILILNYIGRKMDPRMRAKVKLRQKESEQ